MGDRLWQCDSLTSCAKGGAAIGIVMSSSGLGVDDAGMVWACQGGLCTCKFPCSSVDPAFPVVAPPLALALGGGRVYYAEPDAIYSCDQSACASGSDKLEGTARDGGTFGRMLLVGSELVWVAGEWELQRCTLPACSSAVSLTTAPAPIRGLASDGASLYFSVNPERAKAGAIYRCALPACNAAAPTVTGLDDPTIVALDEGNVYWVDRGFRLGGAGAIFKMPK
jgi:hypothetical protein